MFKKKGSSTLVAIVCSLICAALGAFYGMNANRSTPAVAPAISQQPEADPVATTGPAAAQLNTDNMTVLSHITRRPVPAPHAAFARTGGGTMGFARPSTGAAAFSAGASYKAGSFVRPVAGTAVESSVPTTTATATATF